MPAEPASDPVSTGSRPPAATGANRSGPASIVLASSSPRRRELVAQAGLRATIAVPAIDETPQPGEAPAALVERLARAKALAVAADEAGTPIVAADTAVVIDDVMLGKPRDAADGDAMLARLSGRCHHVYSGVAVRSGDRLDTRVVTTRVTLRTLTANERRRYWATGEPIDKAGAYAIQGLGAGLVAHLDGSYSNVVGLPLFETLALLREVGVDPLAIA